MAQRPAAYFGADFAPRGLSLAERRLAYLAELYDSGRWRRFCGDADFLDMVKEAKAAVEIWRGLLRPAPVEIAAAPPTSLATAHAPGLPGPARVDADDMDAFDLVPQLDLAPALDPEPELDPEFDPEPAFDLMPGLDQAPEHDAPVMPWLRRSDRLPPVLFSAHGVLAENDLAEA